MSNATRPRLENRPPPVFGLGSIALAGLFGGPLASACLVATNAKVLCLPGMRARAHALFAIATFAWVYLLFKVPPDFISQALAHIPQVLAWWLIAYALLAKAHTSHKLSGGQFRSAWAAFGIALVFSVGVRVAFAAVSLSL
jgi:hypothetical protein